MTIQVRLRPIKVGNDIFQVPNNVGWQEEYHRWRVMIRIEGEVKTWLFPVKKNITVQEAFVEACRCAYHHRQPHNPRKPRAKKGRDGRAPLPSSINFQRYFVDDREKQRLSVWVKGTKRKGFPLGFKGEYTDEHYAAVLKEAVQYRDQCERKMDERFTQLRLESEELAEQELRKIMGKKVRADPRLLTTVIHSWLKEETT